MLFGVSAPAASVLASDMSALLLAGLLYVGAALAVLPVVRRRPRLGGHPRGDTCDRASKDPSSHP